MANYRTSRIIPVVLVVVIIIIAIAALVSLARVVFFSGSSNNTTTEQVDVSRDALLTTSAGRSVAMTVRGPIVADEKFHSYKIVISPNTRTVTTYTGYLDTVVSQETLGNNVASYEEFVHALDKANLAKGDQFTGDKNDTRGICATGNVYQYAILDGTNEVKNLWTSTCGGSKGSLDASVAQLTNLFVNQLPNAKALIEKVNL